MSPAAKRQKTGEGRKRYKENGKRKTKNKKEKRI
jgi:hypothetical protein